ncbi:MAG: cyclodeaminase/cyclohydrolase family protein [Clostridiales Family XIII bacterium]|jgi:formiminotetrahydrofolate cyclodeaminase|nr:cyclodeaminase/cyclohydrolase family protein [Clostridiales Family XIII bacterium]
MDFVKQSCEAFIDELASKAPVPGGGGASALVGAIGVALGNMACALTVGKKKYAHAQADIAALTARATRLRAELLTLVQDDAEAFLPLARAYGMPKGSDAEKAEKAAVMEAALKDACDVPLAIMEKCCEAIDLHRGFLEKGAAMASSDVGVGVLFCKAALRGASLNVRINTKAMTDRARAAEADRRANAMLEAYEPAADAICDAVSERLT